MNETVKCRFNIFQEGRKYTGHHRKYVLESAKNVINSPETAEGIRLREKVGFYGHGRRLLAGKVAIAEVERIDTPGGVLIIENIPSQVTTHLAIDDDGNVEHHQELILENEPGRIVAGLNKSRVGGFSWACDGKDGGAYGVTKLTGFAGFDYVINPGFSANRGYILESAGRDMILESIVAAGIEEERAEQYLQSWVASALVQNEDLTERLAQAEIYESGLIHEVTKTQARLLALEEERQAIQSQLDGFREAEEARRAIIAESASRLPVAVPRDVAEAIVSMSSERDFGKVIGFFESALRVDLRRYPLAGRSADPLNVSAQRRLPTAVDDYGTAAAAPKLGRREFFNN